MFQVKVEAAFEAAHRVIGYPGKCDRLHGHNWVVEAVIKGSKLDKLGMLVDFKDVRKILENAVYPFDHRFLNEVPPFDTGMNPTAENLARVIYEKMESNEIFTRDVELVSITVFESPKTSVTYTKEQD